MSVLKKKKVTIKIEVWGDCTVDKVTRKGVKWNMPENWEWEVVQHIGEKNNRKVKHAS
jgi:hypothetical protein